MRAATRRLPLLNVPVTLVCAVALGTSTAMAAPVPPFELERLTVSPGAASSLVLGAGDLLPEGGFRLAVGAHYQKDPLLLLRNGEQAGAVVSDRLGLVIAAAFAPVRWLEIGVQAPVVLDQSGDDLTGIGIDRPASSAMGTPFVEARIGLLSERVDHPFDLSLGVGVGLPVGDKAALTRDDSLPILPKLGVGKRLGLVRLGFEGGVWIRGKQALSAGGGDDEVGNQALVGGGIVIGRSFRVEAAARGYLALGSRQPNAAEVLGGIRLPLGSWLELWSLGGPGIGDTPGTPAFRVLGGLALMRPQEAPRPPEPPRPRCEPGVSESPAECPDLDADGDGIRNGVDRCPLEAEDKDGFQDGDGCPDPDNDADAIVDAEDKCPDVKGEARFGGCPPPDADHDGLIDPEDQCPNEAGPPERKGCPIKDKDGDGVEDAADSCIDEPGTAENNGCPATKKQLVVITKQKLVIMDKVYFATAKAKIKPRSFPLLDAIAKLLAEHPEVEHIDIEGHTDSRGKPAKNRALSQARADSVRDYLIGKGVDAGRLTAKGYGPDRPTDTNKTARGREANRRVEFVIKGKE